MPRDVTWHERFYLRTDRGPVALWLGDRPGQAALASQVLRVERRFCALLCSRAFRAGVVLKRERRWQAGSQLQAPTLDPRNDECRIAAFPLDRQLDPLVRLKLEALQHLIRIVGRLRTAGRAAISGSGYAGMDAYGTPMPQSGRRPQHQKPKYSLGADVFRFTPNSRRRLTAAACPKSAVVSTDRRNTLS